MTDRQELAQRARVLWRTIDSGVLSTHSVELPGYPFGSVVPYVTTSAGRAAILISTLAQHTKNIQANPRVCLTAVEPGDGDKQAGARISLLGDAALLEGPALAEVEERYYGLFPSTRAYRATHDFSFYVIAPRRVRFIGGFGAIYWLEGEEWLRPEPAWQEERAGVIEHMNGDHADSLSAMWQAETSESCDSAELLCMDPEGFHLRASERVRYIAFAQRCETTEELRAEMVRLSREARGA